jgi:hypothetical protein
MNNVVAQRFRQEGGQPANITPIPVLPNHDEPKQAADNSPAVSPEILREKLTEKLNPQPIVVEVAQTPIPNPIRLELVHFATLYEFAHWYENNKSLFSEAQHKPLDTLIEARNITTTGCNCDKNKRRMVAEDYFKNFWLKNVHTDLLPTLQKILNTKKLLIGNFISFPE